MEKRDAIIVDVDGTLVDVSSLRHYVISTINEDGSYKTKDFDQFHTEAINCPPIQKTVDLVRDWAAKGVEILILTARSQRYGRHTGFFLAMHDIPSSAMFMRKNGDNRHDVDVKRDILTVLFTRYNILAAIDDNPSVVALWQEHGIPTTVVPGYEA